MLRSILHFFKNWLPKKPVRKPFTRQTSIYFESLENRLCPSLYNYPVVAQTGSTVNANGANGADLGTLTSLSAASINDSGNVAFLGTVNGFTGVDEETGSGVITDLSLTNRDFTFPEIDNNGDVIAQDLFATETYIRTWLASGGGVIDATGETSVTFGNPSGILVLPTISPDGVQFAYLDNNLGSLSMFINDSNPYDPPAWVFPAGSAGLRPMIANTGAVVVQDGSTSTSPIMVFQKGQAPLTIASTSTGFSALGGSPGISGDGKVVVFYGDLTVAGANAINADQPDFTPVDAGPGIFASLATQDGRAIVEISGVSGNPDGVPGLSSDELVGVNSIQPPNGDQTLTITYTGINVSGGTELYYSRLTFEASNGLLDDTDPTTIRLASPVPLLGVGDTIDGLLGAIQSLYLTSTPNRDGQIAITVTTGSNSYAVVRVPTADIVINSVATTDSREAIVDYDINNPNLTQPFYIKIFRSDQPTYSSDDTNNVAVGQPYLVSDLQPGHYTTPPADDPDVIDLSKATPGMAPYVPLAPDPALPYVLAVVVDANGNVPTNVTVDESQAHFKIFIIGAIVPGLQFPLGGDDPSWMTTMQNALQQAYGTDGTTFPFPWQNKYPIPFAAEQAGNALYADLVAVADGLVSELQQNDVFDVQLIGHSRGAAVIGQAMQDLVNTQDVGLEQLQHGYYKMTFLDPHPANQATFGQVRIDPYSLTGNAFLLAYAIFGPDFNDPSVTVDPRVNEVEEYYQTNTTSSVSASALLAYGNTSEQFVNLLGVSSQITVLNDTQTVTNMIDWTDLGLGHSDVHDFYTVSVIPTLANGSPPPPEPSDGSSGSSASLTIDQILEQVLSQEVDDQTEANVLVGDLETASTDLGQGNYVQAVSDLQTFDTTVQSAPSTDFTTNAAASLVSVGQDLVGDLDATDIANVDTANVQSPNTTVSAQASDPQSISGTLTTGSSFSGTGQFSVGNYTQNPDNNPAGQVSQATFDLQTTGLDQNDDASATVTFTGQVPTQELQQATLSYFGDDGQWHTAAYYNGSAWVQVGPSGDMPIQEQDTPVTGSDMSTISLPVDFSNDTTPAVTGLDGTVFTLTVPAPISLTALPGGTVDELYNQAITAHGGTGNITLTVSNSTGSIPGLTIPSGGTNTFTINGTPTAAGTVSFTVQATDSVGMQFSQNYALTVTTDDPTRSTISLLSNSVLAGATTTVTLTAVNISGGQETSGGQVVGFSLGSGSGAGNFSAVTDNGNGTYSAVFTGTRAGSNTITATMNGQPVTTSPASVTVTPGAVSVAASTVSVSPGALPVGGTTTVTLTAMDANGNQETTGGLPVSFNLSSTLGTFSQVTDNGNGTYTTTFNATSAGSATIGATIDGQSVTSLPADITVVALSLAQSGVSAIPGTIPGNGTATVTLTAIDADGNQETTGGLNVAFGLGAGSGSGTFGPATDNGNGTYTATFSATSIGSTSITATIDGFALPTTAALSITGWVNVTTNPTSQVAGAGNSVSFVAAAVGSPTPTVQWQVSTDGGNTFTNITGATSTTLTLTPTSAQNLDDYRAVFTNSSGSATTTVATLTINTTPSDLIISTTSNLPGNDTFPQFNLVNPDPSDSYFKVQTVLSNGNLVAVAYNTSFTVYTVYLFNGQTGALISALAGNGSDETAIALTNGNFVVVSPFDSQVGVAVTWGSGTSGVNGTVSAANSLVVGGQGVGYKVIPLTNGNYVVDAYGWNGGTGAVTWCNGTTGTTGTISAANSLIGSTSGDQVGGGIDNQETDGVTALPNGDYVVDSPSWNSGEGAVTWCNGTTGTTGTVSAVNSLVGSNSGDKVGIGFNAGVTVLANGNYVVDSPDWNNYAGAITWGSGTAGIDGVVSADNSLIGTSLSATNSGEEVVTALTNGNYVVANPSWTHAQGAVTWCNGTTGTSGIVSAANSLVGSSNLDQVGAVVGLGHFSGVTALSNGNYVVDSDYWHGYEGAVTWGNGTTGTTGTVSAANSLIGSSGGREDEVGLGGVIALTNGNYVVDSPYWNVREGAVTWGNGTTGTIGTVSAANSLVGTNPYNTNAPNPSDVGGADEVGLAGVTALTNGNYVVDSEYWNLNAGAVTLGNGTTGTSGTVSAANSLVGTNNLFNSSLGDIVGGGGVTALSNGNYVVDNWFWNGKTGAVTWGNGLTGISGTISAANSLIGTVDGDSVGLNYYILGGGAIALPNGNYVVDSPSSVTWGNGTTGITGTVSTANSLTTSASDIAVLPSGNYVVSETWVDSTGETLDGETWVDSTTGQTLDGQNTPEAQNTLENGGGIIPSGSGTSYIVGATVAFTDPNLITYALGQGQTITVSPDFLTRSLDAGTNVTLQANNDITINSPITETPNGTAGSLTLQAGRSILINANVDTGGGNLTLIANDTAADGVVESEREPGNGTITMASGVTLDTAGGTLSISGNSGPQVTMSTITLPASATSLTINGSGFSTAAANDAVTFSGGATGTVTAATATQLTVTSLSGLVAGTLTASVTVSGASSGNPVQVATVTPVVTSSTSSIAANTTSLTINGFGFSSTLADDTVTLSGGGSSNVTAASATQLTVSGLTGLMPGNLSASVTVSGISSGMPVQVATVTSASGGPQVTMSTSNLLANATVLIINGSGFSIAAANDTVTLSGGATGTVTAASATQLTVTSVTGLVAGSLTASVSVSDASSGPAVQVATVTPVVTLNTVSLLPNGTTITINGFGFSSSTLANNTVTFSGGVTGNVTTASTTQLTVANLTGLTVGSLSASVTVSGVSSGTPVQVATVTLAVPMSGPSGPIATVVPTFVWNNITGVTSYEIWLTDQTIETYQTFTGQSGPTFNLPGASELTVGHNYVWWVGAIVGRTIIWSNSQSFSIPLTASGPNGTNTNAQPTFSWDPVTGVTNYTIWLTDQTTGVVTTYTNLPGPSAAPTPALTPGDKYIWWVGAVQGPNIDWDSAQSFTITPTISSPSGAIATVTPTFSWTPMTGATVASYTVWISDQTAGTVQTFTGQAGPTFNLPDADALTVGHNYIWWVGTVQGETTIWSNGQTFSIPLTATGPSGTITNAIPTFSWNAVSGITNYTIWLTDQTTGVTTTFTNLPGPSAAPTPALALGDSYIWWVGAVQGKITTWDSGQTFTISLTGTGPNGTITNAIPTFSWNAVSGITNYTIWLTDQTTGVTTTYTNLPGPSAAPTPALALGDSYIWWVGAVQGKITIWDSAQTFTIAPTISGPNGAIATVTPSFSWSPVTGATVDSYTVWLTDQTTGTFQTFPVQSGSTFNLPGADTLTVAHNYIWWVGAVQGGTTTWSSGQTFTIQLTANGPSGTITNVMPTFSWNLVNGVTGYTIWLTDQTTAVTTIYTNLPGSSAAPTPALALGDTYIWWVGAVQGSNTMWDSAMTFDILP